MIYKAFQVTVPYFIHRVENHLDKRDEIIGLIDAQAASVRGYQRTDEDGRSERKYIPLVQPLFVAAIQDMVQELNCTFKVQGRPWFTQYSHTEFCRWHIHENCHWVFVYYLEFPEGSPYTTFKTLDGSKEFEVPVKEGDIMIFPGFFKHCSKVNHSQGRKTVITLNTTQWTTQKELMEPIEGLDVEEMRQRVYGGQQQ